MTARFIVRVDDVGQDVEQTNRDRHLRSFARWMDAWGPCDEPIYFGVVPAILASDEWYGIGLMERVSRAVMAIHGWDHKPGVLTAEDVRRGAEMMPDSRVVIPPFNLYDGDTIKATARLGEDAVLLGGFHGEHHRYGPAPAIVDGVLHVSAHPDLYARAYQLLEAVEQLPDPGYPLQLVLHHRWDAPYLDGVKKLSAALKGRIVSVDEAWPA